MCDAVVELYIVAMRYCMLHIAAIEQYVIASSIIHECY